MERNEKGRKTIKFRPKGGLAKWVDINWTNTSNQRVIAFIISRFVGTVRVGRMFEFSSFRTVHEEKAPAEGAIVKVEGTIRASGEDVGWVCKAAV